MKRVAPLVFLSVMLVAPVGAEAQNYTFRVLAVTGTQYTAFFNPTIGPNGDVAVMTNPATGGVGILRSSGGQTQLVYTASGGIGGLLTVDRNGRILFNRNDGVLSRAPGSLSVFAASGLMVPFGEEAGLFACRPSLPGATISTAGTVPLSCVFDSVPGDGPFFSLQRFNGATADRICDSGRSLSNPGQPVFPTCVAQGLPGGGPAVAVSPNGLFAAIVESQSDSAPPELGIATSTLTGLQTVLTASQLAVSGAQFLNVSVNDSGDVAFAASHPALSSANVFVVDALGQFQPLVQLVGPTSVGGFGSAYNISINAAGRVVFDANRWIQPGTLGQGLYTGPDPVRDKVIEYGNFLPGFTKSVTELALGQPGINDTGQIVFVAGLSDGRQVLVVAEPVTRRLTVARAGTGTGVVTSAPTGVDCGTDCVQDYPMGTAVQLVATPAPGSNFTSWTGCGSVVNGSCLVTMTAARTVTATFTSHTLTVMRAGTGAGSVTSTPPGIDCGVDCTEGFAPGTSVQLVATPAPGSAFTSWTGCGSVVNGSCLVTMTAARTVTATFTSHKLTVMRAGTGVGSVTSTPGGIDCGVDCIEGLAPGTSVQLVATPAPGSVFTSWTGCGSVVNGSCLVTMTAARTVTATFTSHKLTVRRVGTGAGSVSSTPPGIDCGVDCTEGFAPGTSVQLVATPAPGSAFTSWTGCGSVVNGSCFVTMTAPRTVTATFISHKLTVMRAGTGTGSVTSTPAGIDCGVDCIEGLVPGTSVQLVATPAPGSSFMSWTGCGSVVNGSCLVTMTAARTVTATFTSHKLTVMRAGTGTGSVTSTPPGIDCGVDCTEGLVPGTSVQLVAIPAPGSSFMSWTGCGSVVNGSCLVTMTAARTVTATFTSHKLTVMRAGTGTGSVTSAPAGIDCGVDCTEGLVPGTSVQLVATPAPGSSFMSWTGCGSIVNGSCVVTMAAPRTVTATFTSHKLTVIRAGTGTGSVTSAPAGIDCGVDCTEGLVPGTSVQLVATPAPGSSFMSWTGCGGIVNGSCVVTMAAPRTVTATFTSHKVTVMRAGTGTGSVASTPLGIDCGVDCTEGFAPGTSVQLVATPAPGSGFTSWTGCGSVVNGSCVVTMTAARTVTATFTSHKLTVMRAGTGTITSTPAGIDCGVDCTEGYAPRTSVQLVATPAPGSSFMSWTGCGSVVNGSCSVTMTAVRTVTATFTTLRINVGDGTPASCTEMALRHALGVAEASGGGTIQFKCGQLPVSIMLSEPAGVSNLRPLLLIPPDNTTIDGGGMITLVGRATPADTVVVFVSRDAAVVLENLSITQDSSKPDSSNPILWNAGTLTVNNSTVFGSKGGGIANAGTLTVNKSTVSHNGEAYYSGVGGISSWGQLTVTDSVVSRNGAYTGGGISNGGTARVVRSRIVSNVAEPWGGGISNYGVLIVTDSEISKNGAFAEGGGIDNEGTLEIQNTTISGNSCSMGAGGISNWGTLTVENSEVSGNRGAEGGGIRNCRRTTPGTAIIKNSTITNNTAFAFGAPGGGILTCRGSTTILENTTVMGNRPDDIAP